MADSPDHVYVTYIRASAEAVWSALTEGAQTAKYYYGTSLESTLEPGSGYRYTYPGGEVAADGEIISVEPGVELVMSFQARWDPDLVAEGPIRMTWRIDPAGPGVSKLTVTQEGMGPKQSVEFTGGIPYIVSGLKSLLETGEVMAQG